MFAYHFVASTLRDGRPVPANGVWLEHRGEAVLCEQGLHASLHPFDALKYAPGSTLCRVEMGGTIVQGDDKLVATKRRIVARIDAEPMLRAFARKVAAEVYYKHFNKGQHPAIDDWLLHGRNKYAAESAAVSAAESAAEYAAESAAEYAAESAAEYAARSAARSAAWSAAESAVWSAVRSAAWSAAESAAWYAAESAVWSAVWSAAWSAANKSHRDLFLQMVASAFAEADAFASLER